VGGTISRFFYSGWQELEEQNVANATVATYVWGLGIDELLTMTRGQEKYFFHADELGSVMKVTAAGGNVAEGYSYGDYGKPSFFDQFGNEIEQGNIGNPYHFIGRRWDYETRFYEYRTRYLEPATGRFISRDLIGSWGDVGNIGNAYTYVGNNPPSALDPLGLQDSSPAANAQKAMETANKREKAIDRAIEVAKILLSDDPKEGIKELAKSRILDIAKDEVKKLVEEIEPRARLLTDPAGVLAEAIAEGFSEAGKGVDQIGKRSRRGGDSCEKWIISACIRS
jgi:RHS repeat-associated protein